MRNFICFLLVLTIQLSYAQVSINNKGNRLVKDGTEYRFNKYREVFTNQDAKRYFKKARTNKTISTVLSFSGGFVIGAGLGIVLTAPKERVENVYYPGGYYQQTVKAEKLPMWPYLALGGGLIATSIPFYLSTKKNTEKALQLENGESTAFKPYLKVESSSNGIALSYNF